MRYVIGDVHGLYGLLMRLVKKLPADAELIFVGDLIDRGADSKEVIRFIREHGYQSVMGNHEKMMITESHSVIQQVRSREKLLFLDRWRYNGGIATLISYGIISHRQDNGGLVIADDATVHLDAFRSDVKWMETLPLYIELQWCDAKERPYVVSHAAIDKVWNLRYSDIKAHREKFLESALWSRQLPGADSVINNIFGHTPTSGGVWIGKHYVNVDTGAYLDYDPDLGRLSAYCVETGDVVSVRNAAEDRE